MFQRRSEGAASKEWWAVNNVEDARLLLTNGRKVNGRLSNDLTPLMIAVLQSHVSVAEFLLDNGAQVDSRTKFGCQTTRNSVIDSMRAELLKVLLADDPHTELYAIMNIGGFFSIRALHAACINNNSAMIKMLMEYGADANADAFWKPARTEHIQVFRPLHFVCRHTQSIDVGVSDERLNCIRELLKHRTVCVNLRQWCPSQDHYQVHTCMPTSLHNLFQDLKSVLMSVQMHPPNLRKEEFLNCMDNTVTAVEEFAVHRADFSLPFNDDTNILGHDRPQLTTPLNDILNIVAWITRFEVLHPDMPGAWISISNRLLETAVGFADRSSSHFDYHSTVADPHKSLWDHRPCGWGLPEWPVQTPASAIENFLQIMETRLAKLRAAVPRVRRLSCLSAQAIDIQDPKVADFARDHEKSFVMETMKHMFSYGEVFEQYERFAGGAEDSASTE